MVQNMWLLPWYKFFPTAMVCAAPPCLLLFKVPMMMSMVNAFVFTHQPGLGIAALYLHLIPERLMFLAELIIARVIVGRHLSPDGMAEVDLALAGSNFVHKA